jgi:uncharacterized membrane protein YfcA
LIAYSPLTWLVLLAAAAGGGAANALAGGGTFLAFPALLFAGVSPIGANATSSLVLNPAGYASAWVYRDRLVHGRGFQTAMAISSVAGALVGGELLLQTSERSFERLIPYLMLSATLLFSFSRQLRAAATGRAAQRTHAVPMLTGQFLIAVYGGYFGAGMGVLMLVLYTIAASMDVQEASGLRLLCGTLINTVATVLFAVRGIVLWTVGIPMMLACIAGGYWGAKLVKNLKPETAHRAILIFAWMITLWLFVRSLI